jgi:hypothetical protein
MKRKRKKEGVVRVLVVLTVETRGMLDRMASVEGETRSSMVRRLVREEMERRG